MIFSIVHTDYGETKEIIIIKVHHKSQISDYIRQNTKKIMSIIMHIWLYDSNEKHNIYLIIVKNAFKKYYNYNNAIKLFCDKAVFNNDGFINYVCQKIQKQSNDLLVNDFHGHDNYHSDHSSIEITKLDDDNFTFIEL